MDSFTILFVQNDLFSLLRAIGFTVLCMLICFCFVFIRGHRWVFVTTILWSLAVVISILVRYMQDVVFYEFVLNCIVTPLQWIMIVSVGVLLFQVLQKQKKK